MATIYAVISSDGLEGCFAARSDAEQYLAALRRIGARRLRVEPIQNGAQEAYE